MPTNTRVFRIHERTHVELRAFLEENPSWKKSEVVQVALCDFLEAEGGRRTAARTRFEERLWRGMKLDTTPWCVCTFQIHEALRRDLDAFVEANRGWQRTDAIHVALCDFLAAGDLRQALATMRFHERLKRAASGKKK